MSLRCNCPESGTSGSCPFHDVRSGRDQDRDDSRAGDLAGPGVSLLLSTERRWSCPNCSVEDVTHDPRPHSRFHTCVGLRGLTAPLVPAGTKAKVEAVERGDYIRDEHVQLTEGRPVMAVITTRDDGQDVTVFAPTASGTVKE